MTHTIIHDSALNGWEYGMLRSFEKAIIEKTQASISPIPKYPYLTNYMHHFGQGMNRAKFRKYLPKNSWQPNGEIGWYILMGPENYQLDLFKDWDKNLKTKILYVYDTFPSQYPLIKRLCQDKPWDVMITSFNDAVNDLQRITGCQWHCVEQAADEHLFTGAAFDEKTIHFSAYGRRYPALHDVVKEFCGKKGLYYDYTTHDSRHPTADSTELYKQYAWHLNHSLFTFSWPVEFTNPTRAGHLHPITCRWFEAMASGTVIIGRKPGNAVFDEWLADDLVIELDPHAPKNELLINLEKIWERRKELHDIAQKLRTQVVGKISWNERVHRILSLL